MRLYQLNGHRLDFDIDYANKLGIFSIQIIIGVEIIADFSLIEHAYWLLPEIKNCFITIKAKINGTYFFYGKEWITNTFAEEIDNQEKINDKQINEVPLPLPEIEEDTKFSHNPPLIYDVKQKLTHLQNIMKGKLENVLR